MLLSSRQLPTSDGYCGDGPDGVVLPQPPTISDAETAAALARSRIPRPLVLMSIATVQLEYRGNPASRGKLRRTCVE